MKADLHCHTTISDGSLGISDVIRQADRNDVRCLAITDHDSLASLSRSAVLGKRYNVNVIPAVEFSAFDSERKKKVHILCYMPAKPDRLEGLCLRTSTGRMELGKRMAVKVLDKYPITLESILRYSAGSKAIYKCHIMHALMDYGYTTELYGDVYDSIFDVNDGICADEVASEANFYPDVHFVTTLIRASGGISVMAHPKVYDSTALLEELASKHEIDGVEVWHRRPPRGSPACSTLLSGEPAPAQSHPPDAELPLCRCVPAPRRCLQCRWGPGRPERCRT